jgi:two-component system, NarL family, sensor kinase
MSTYKAQIFAILIVLTVFVLVMIVFIVFILFLIQKKQKGFVSDLIAVKANYEKERYKAQMEIQEQTFQDISREIHDNVGQMLSLAKLGVNMLDLERINDAKNDILGISDILDNSLDQLRHLCRSMNSDLIKTGGLKKSIEMQVGFLQSGNKFKIEFNVSNDNTRLSETKQVILFRIVQEAMTNIIRHAKASSITILLDYNPDFVLLKIQDNGKGFLIDYKQINPRQINGIHNMEHRAKIIDADFEIKSNLGSGTTVIVKTPY